MSDSIPTADAHRHKTDKRIIGFDLDDVIFNFMDPLIEWHNQFHGTTHSREEYTTFNLHEIWDSSEEEGKDRVADFYESEHYAAALPIDGALPILQQLKDRYTLVIITARSESLRKETTVWLEKHFPGIFEELYFTNHFYNISEKRSKSSVCLDVGVKIFIDDSVSNALDVASVGIPVLLFDTPWNRKLISPLVTRVHSWKEIAEKIEETGSL